MLVEHTKEFHGATPKKEGKPFFVWHNTTWMNVSTYLPQKYSGEHEHSKTNYGLRGWHGAARRLRSRGHPDHLDAIGEADNTHRDF